MPGHKNTTPTDESAAHCAKLTELEQVCEQLQEEEHEAVVVEACECEAAARCEHEVMERRGWEAAEK